MCICIQDYKHSGEYGNCIVRGDGVDINPKIGTYRFRNGIIELYLILMISKFGG